jgi:hypothetical protein
MFDLEKQTERAANAMSLILAVVFFGMIAWVILQPIIFAIESVIK